MKLRNRMELFRERTRNRKSLVNTFVTSFGIANGSHTGVVNSEVTLDGLFAKWEHCWKRVDYHTFPCKYLILPYLSGLRGGDEPVSVIPISKIFAPRKYGKMWFCCYVCSGFCENAKVMALNWGMTSCWKERLKTCLGDFLKRGLWICLSRFLKLCLHRRVIICEFAYSQVFCVLIGKAQVVFRP